ncbi:MAG: methyltransferase domain-containing protein [Vicinamibacterales bacterium]|nr:methyltransferase domain-containing protein [Vicinamibacterales bacterium]
MTTEPASVTSANLANYDSPWSVAAYGANLRGLFPAEQAIIDEYFPPPPSTVLDLGCGAGRTTVALHEAGYRVTGIDLSQALVAEARRLYPAIDVRLMDATALEVPDASVDVAFFSYNGIDCLYPVSARERCFAEVYRVLRPGGVFLLSSHNAIGAIFSGGYFYPRGYLNALAGLWRQRGNPYLREWYWRYDDPGGAQHLFSAPPSRTVAQARAAGFEVLEVRGATGERDPGRIARRQQHVYFVLRHP